MDMDSDSYSKKQDEKINKILGLEKLKESNKRYEQIDKTNVKIINTIKKDTDDQREGSSIYKFNAIESPVKYVGGIMIFYYLPRDAMNRLHAALNTFHELHLVDLRNYNYGTNARYILKEIIPTLLSRKGIDRNKDFRKVLFTVSIMNHVTINDINLTNQLDNPSQNALEYFRKVFGLEVANTSIPNMKILYNTLDLVLEKLNQTSPKLEESKAQNLAILMPLPKSTPTPMSTSTSTLTPIPLTKSTPTPTTSMPTLPLTPSPKSMTTILAPTSITKSKYDFPY